MSNTMYCRGEGKEFDKSEFERSEQGAWIHNTVDPHYALTGESVSPIVIPEEDMEPSDDDE